MPYYVYIVQCYDGTLYTGYSRNPKKRLKLHMNGRGARYLRTHKPKELVYLEEFCSRANAMRRERHIKLMSHAQKLRLRKSNACSKRYLARLARNRKKDQKEVTGLNGTPTGLEQ